MNSIKLGHVYVQKSNKQAYKVLGFLDALTEGRDLVLAPVKLSTESMTHLFFSPVKVKVRRKSGVLRTVTLDDLEYLYREVRKGDLE